MAEEAVNDQAADADANDSPSPKRRKSVDEDGEEAAEDGAAEGAMTKEVLDTMECTVCTELLLDPVTTSCGHTFCRGCLRQSLDHNTKCPMCRTARPQGLTPHFYFFSMSEAGGDHRVSAGSHSATMRDACLSNHTVHLRLRLPASRAA
jgi:hypothetical protein